MGDGTANRGLGNRGTGNRGLGDQGTGSRGTSNRGPDNRGTSDRGTGNGGVVPSPPSPRCRQFVIESVPATYSGFEAVIEQRVAFCVQSRTGGAHRERELVRGNASLLAVWNQLQPGQRARVVPEYNWGPNRVESIDFSSPDIKPRVAAAAAGPVGPNVASSPGFGPTSAPPGSDSPPPRVRPPQAIFDPPPPRTRPGVPGLNELLDLARRMEDTLRRSGQVDDANRLGALIAAAATATISLGLLVGAYIFAARYLGGVSIQWGWTLTDDHEFTRRWGRASQVITELNGQFDRIAAIAEKHHKLLAGSGIHWPTIPKHPLPDPLVVGQMDKVACGPACVEMVLSHRGLRVSQLDAAIVARGFPGTQVDFVRPDGLLRALQTLDPSGMWVGGQLEGAIDRTVLSRLSSTGSWIAWVPVDGVLHSIVIAGVDLNRDVILVMDPWVVATRSRGQGLISGAANARFGSSYAVSLKVFLARWPGIVFRATVP